MGRSNKRRKTSLSISCGYYYPIYTGWVSKRTPIFTTPSAALCYQLVQYKRDLLVHNTIKSPPWVDCVGSIHPSDFDNIQSDVFYSPSKIENAYFENVKFYRLKDTTFSRSRLVRVVAQTFLSCQNTLKDNTDYHSSSTSIYKPGSFCIEENNIKSISSNFDTKGISQKRDSNNLIAISLNVKKLIYEQRFHSVDYIIQRLVNMARSYKGSKIVVSVGAGSGVTELSSSILTLCVDINKRSLFTGLSQIDGEISTSSTIFALMDYSTDITKLLEGIKNALPGKVIHVLLQHPNPSIDEDNRSKLALLFESLRLSLLNGISYNVTFVYDFSTNRNTWTKATLQSLFMHNSNESHFNVTVENLVSCKGDNNVNHPLFGITKRYGWAAMRNCDEYSFSISFNNTK